MQDKEVMSNCIYVLALDGKLDKLPSRFLNAA